MISPSDQHGSLAADSSDQYTGTPARGRSHYWVIRRHAYSRVQPLPDLPILRNPAVLRKRSWASTRRSKIYCYSRLPAGWILTPSLRRPFWRFHMHVDPRMVCILCIKEDIHCTNPQHVAAECCRRTQSTIRVDDYVFEFEGVL